MTGTILLVSALLAMGVGLFVFRAIPGYELTSNIGVSALLPARKLTNLPL
jgi:hypothetical protein